jgi:cell division protein FtsW
MQSNQPGALHRIALLAAAILLALLCTLQAFALWRAAPTWSPTAIEVSLASGQAITLGQNELAAPQADRNHIGVRRDALGAWWIRNVSAGKQVLLQTPASEQRLRSHALLADTQFRIGSALFTVTQSSTTNVSFTDEHQQRWRYDGALLYRDDAALAPCPDASLHRRALLLWNRWMPSALQIAQPLLFGGNLYCDNRLGLPAVSTGAASLTLENGTVLLTPGNPDGEQAGVSVLLPPAATIPAAIDGGGNDEADLRQQEQPLAGASALVLGHTRLQLALQSERMVLIPGWRVRWFNSPDVALPAGVAWHWQMRDDWQWQRGKALWLGGALLTMALLAATLAWAGGRWPFQRGSGWQLRMAWLAALVICILGLVALLMPKFDAVPGLGYSLLLGWCALWLWPLLPGRLTLTTAMGVLLLAIGMLAQLEQGLGGTESFWLRHFQKTVALAAIALGAGALLQLRLTPMRATALWSRLRPLSLRPPSLRATELTLAVLTICTLGLLVLQVLFGDETGVFGIQPVELTKLALVAVTAHSLAMRIEWQRSPQAGRQRWELWLRLVWPVLLLLALVVVALVQVSDYSPLLLLLVWGMVIALAYAAAARSWVTLGVLGSVGALAAASIMLLRSGGGAELVQWGFYADRFLVWLDPALHPFTGQQFLLGAQAIAAGGWWGVDQLLGLSTLGQPVGAVLQIPAVQDDFAAAFFLNRHGLAAGLVLWLLQAAFICGLLHGGWRAYAMQAQEGDFRRAWLGRFCGFALCGGAGFVLAQVLLSWGTNLAIFPVMGQPMSFLSAGGSHLLFFLLPLLGFHAITAAITAATTAQIPA